MAPQLPWELEEEILSRLPPRCLARFKTVCKQWNGLFNDKSFLNNHLSRSRPQFIFLTHSKVYSIDIIDPDSIDPAIELRELHFPCGDIHDLKRTNITTCDELLLCNYRFLQKSSWTALWNPWLKQVKMTTNDAKEFAVFGLGYDNIRPEKGYKILGNFFCIRRSFMSVAIYDSASHAFKFIDTPDFKDWFSDIEKTRRTVSLNGNLYWVTNLETTREYVIRSFDFVSFRVRKTIFLMNFSLAVFKGDRFSLLKQCGITRKIGIWVTREKINNNNGDGVVWIKLMTLPTSNLPKLFDKFYRISYFISDKTLFMCCGDDETGVACIFIGRGDLCKKIQIVSGIVECCHCVYTPNLISVP